MMSSLMCNLTLLICLCSIIVNSYHTTSNRVIKMTANIKSKQSASDSKPIVIPKSDNNLKFDLGKLAFSFIPLTPESQGRRKTILTEVVKDTIWTLDQLQGVINVNVPVRSTVIKLKEGGLFVNNPVAPTKECISYVKELEKRFGPVKYITLSSLAIEHKGTAGIFSSYFPSSQVYYQPGQYAFPVDLPPQFFFPLGKSIG